MRRSIGLLPLALFVACKGPLPVHAARPPSVARTPVPDPIAEQAVLTPPVPPVIGRDEDPAGFSGVRLAGGLRVDGPRRAPPSLVCETELAKLPALADNEIPKRWVFDLRQNENGGYRLLVRGMLLAEAEVADCRAYTWMTGLAPSSAGGLGCALPTSETPAKLRAVDLDDWSEETLGYVEEDTTYDAKTGLAAPHAARRAEAGALLPSVVYALVVPGETERELVLLAPAATWVSARGTAKEQENPHIGSFTIVRVPLDADVGTTVAMDFQESALASFHSGPPYAVTALRSRDGEQVEEPPREPASISVSIEVHDGRIRTNVVELSPSNMVRAKKAAFRRAATGPHAAADPCGCAVPSDAGKG